MSKPMIYHSGDEVSYLPRNGNPAGAEYFPESREVWTIHPDANRYPVELKGSNTYSNWEVVPYG